MMTTNNNKTEYELLEQDIASPASLADMIKYYKLAIFHEKRFGALKDMARHECERLFLEWKQTHRKSTFEHSLGTCGYTEPKKKQLNKVLWEKALRENEHLSRIQAEYNLALAVLEAAQEAFMELPEPKFYAK